MLKGIKYFFLVPFAPLKFFYAFEEEKNHRGIGRWAFLFGILLSIITTLIELNSNGLEIHLLFSIFSLAALKFFSYALFGFAIILFSAITQAGLKKLTFILPIFGLSMLPKLLSQIINISFDTNTFDLYWIGTIWETIILAIGLHILGQVNITKSSIIAVLSVVAMIVFQYYYGSRIPLN